MILNGMVQLHSLFFTSALRVLENFQDGAIKGTVVYPVFILKCSLYTIMQVCS
jgi:hypothetical protein